MKDSLHPNFMHTNVLVLFFREMVLLSSSNATETASIAKHFDQVYIRVHSFVNSSEKLPVRNPTFVAKKIFKNIISPT